MTEFIKRRVCMKENALSKKRLDYLDLAKGIGILIVMLGHFPVDGEPHISRQLYDFIFSFHMPLFFIITGIIFGYNRKWEKQTFKELFIKKLKTIIYPYFTLSAVALILQTLEMVFLHFGSPFDLQVTALYLLLLRLLLLLCWLSMFILLYGRLEMKVRWAIYFFSYFFILYVHFLPVFSYMQDFSPISFCRLIP